jgi:DinB superfamily
MKKRNAELVALIDQGFNVRSWHGPNLQGSLRGVSVRLAAWRPTPERHNIWEIAVHAAYWKYRICRQIAASPPPAFDRKGSDWFRLPAEQTQRAWKADRQALSAWHARLRAAVEQLDPGELDRRRGKERRTFRWIITGIAAHDLYHAGQIRLLRRMAETAGVA